MLQTSSRFSGWADVVLDQAEKAVLDSQTLPAVIVHRRLGDGADDRVEAGAVAAAGQNADAFDLPGFHASSSVSRQGAVVNPGALRDPTAGNRLGPAIAWCRVSKSDDVSAIPPELPSRQSPAFSCIVLTAILLASRLWVVRHPVPVHGDEVEFIAALGFPRPLAVHHPGYPLWVAMGTALWWIGVPGYGAYQTWSILASVVSPLLLYLSLRRIVADRLAWHTALAMGFSPLVWFMSSTALNYPAAMALSILIATCCWRAAVDHSVEALRRAAIGLALGLLLRPDLLVWLGPLFLWTAWRTRGRHVLPALAVVGCGLGALLAALTWLYHDPTGARPGPALGRTISVIWNTSVFRAGLVDGLLRNLVKLSANLVWDFGLGSLILVAILPNIRRVHRRERTTVPFVAMWTAPMLAFFLLIHMSEAGHVYALIPAGYWLMAVGIQTLVRSRHSHLAAAVALCSVVQFAAYPWTAESMGWKRLVDAKIGYLSAAGLRHIDQRSLIHRPGDFWPTNAHDRP